MRVQDTNDDRGELLKSVLVCAECGEEWTSRPLSFHDLAQSRAGLEVACEECGALYRLTSTGDGYLFSFGWKKVHGRVAQQEDAPALEAGNSEGSTPSPPTT